MESRRQQLRSSRNTHSHEASAVHSLSWASALTRGPRRKRRLALPTTFPMKKNCYWRRKSAKRGSIGTRQSRSTEASSCFLHNNAAYALQLAHAETLAGRPVMAMDTHLKQLRQLRLRPSSDRQLDLAEAEAAAVVSDFRRQKELSARAVEKARRSGDSIVVARAERAAPHLRSLVLGNLAEALALWEEILVFEGRWAEAREALEESRKIAHWRVPVGENLASETLTRARLYAPSGRLQEAKREARGARLPWQ